MLLPPLTTALNLFVGHSLNRYFIIIYRKNVKQMLTSYKYRYGKVPVALYDSRKNLEYLCVEWAISDENYSPPRCLRRPFVRHSSRESHCSNVNFRQLIVAPAPSLPFIQIKSRRNGIPFSVRLNALGSGG